MEQSASYRYYISADNEELFRPVEIYIYFYNYKRFQKRLSHLAPTEYRCQMAA
ncbi:IS3 family transposase [Peribacillus glennii]|uniref:Integrase catalytic domain-containing protein n=1 Tax=Peribacillus glennii TaxID=2303991 RepID=A0A372L736_9BACI|nr:hypothetical protein D0466_19895 [Peribacillus glennii]